MIAVLAAETALEAAARELAARLGLPLATTAEASHPFFLVLTAQRLELREKDQRSGPVYVEFRHGYGGVPARRLADGGHPLIKALRHLGVASTRSIRPIRVVDATAGLGREAFFLARMHCQVTMLERSPIMAALLRDGLERAKGAHPALDAILQRLEFRETDAIAYLTREDPEFRPDLIYLDPMFPSRRKSARVKKELARLHRLLGEDGDADRLLLAALAHAEQRVVVKRPAGTPAIAGPEPTYTITGGDIRLDIYQTNLSNRSRG